MLVAHVFLQTVASAGIMNELATGCKEGGGAIAFSTRDNRLLLAKEGWGEALNTNKGVNRFKFPSISLF